MLSSVNRQPGHLRHAKAHGPAFNAVDPRSSRERDKQRIL